MQKRLLFVDDEEIIRELYGSLDTVLGAEHEICTASGGREALQLMRDKSFDVIVSDLAMPQMDGVEFLSEVVQSRPESARIIVSGFADRIKVAECLTVGHRFFNKPFNFKALSALLRRICQYQYLVSSDQVRRIVCGKKALPTPPDTYLRLTEALNNEYTEIEDIGRIVERDPGLSTKLIQIVNSAQFGLSRQIVSPAEAVSILGIEVLRALMLGTQIFSFYDESNFVKLVFTDLWNHSLKTAVAARKIAVAERLSTPACEECFLAGLLHDIGKLVLAANSETQYQLVLDLVAKEKMSLRDAERGIYSSDHSQVGAYLLALWGVSDTVIRAVELHHTLDSAEITEFGPLLAVHVAQNLDPHTSREALLDTATLERLGLLERVDEWREILASPE